MIDRHPRIEDVLDAWAPSLGPARAAYSGHVYRVFNVSRRIFGSDRRLEELAVASVFHDLGIWSDRTFDYIAPSRARASEWIETHALEVHAGLVADIIENHHLLRRKRTGVDSDVVEAFRRADLVDVSCGLLGAGVERAFLTELTTAFPRAGFHALLVRAAVPWFIRHPLRPLPMVRLFEPATRPDDTPVVANPHI